MLKLMSEMYRFNYSFDNNILSTAIAYAVVLFATKELLDVYGDKLITTYSFVSLGKKV